MGAGLGIDALVGEAKPLDRPAVDQVLFDDLRGIFGLHVPVPNRLGIHDHRGAMLALIEAAGLVNANRAAQACGLGKLLKLRVQFAFAVRSA